MQIKTTMKYHYTPSRMAEIKCGEAPSICEDLKRCDPLSTLLVECETVQLLRKTFWQFLKKK